MGMEILSKNRSFALALTAALCAALALLSLMSAGQERQLEVSPVVRQAPRPQVEQFDIKIDKIGVTSPVLEGVDGKDEAAYMESLQGGVAHYRGTALPGEGGNIFIFGHSSTETGIGPYAEIFARLGELEEGDEIRIDFKGRPYIYTVGGKRIVAENDLSVLEPAEEERLTLMTCWPIGTDKKRLIVVASPKLN